MKWVLLLAMAVTALAADFYEVLGVSRDATDKELRKAYRALSRQHHPDKNRGDEASAQKFIEISEAYEVLSDPEKRKVFDRYGEEGLKNGGGMHQDPMDMFQHFFGGGMQFGGQFGQQFGGARQGHNTMTMLEASLADMYVGKKLEISLRLKGICDECDGTGSADGHREKCKVCNGHGQRMVRHQIAPGIVQQMQTVCDVCKGKGTTISKPCSLCHGERVVEEDRKYNVFLEPHSESQWDYVLEGEGDQNPDWNPGHLIVRITQSKTDNMGFRRRGFNLFRDEVLNAVEAEAGGWKRTLTHLDQTSKIVLQKKKGQMVYNGMVEKIAGEGMPKNEYEHGDLYIRYVVVGSHSHGGHDEL